MQGIRIGSAFGIPIKLNWTFLLVLPLFAAFIVFDLAALVEVVNGVFGTGIDSGPLTAGLTPWLLGFSVAVGLFLGVLLHEFGHSLVALRYGYAIDSITLWLLGGVASFEEFPEDWRHELVIAVAGPVVSVLVGVAAYAGFLGVPAGLAGARFVLAYLAILNVVLAVFNLLPAFPMDGGRVLRALLARNQPRAQATQQAAAVGKGFAFLLGMIGLFTNLFLILLALFVYMAASGEAQQTAIQASFEGVTVRDVMTGEADLHTVTGETSVADLLARMFEERHTGYPVVRNGRLVGMVTLDDATGIEEVERDAYRVEDVMSTDVATIEPGADAAEALGRMQEHGVGRLPVVEDGGLVGIVSRTDLMRAFNIIQQSGTPSRFRPGESEPTAR
jgi:Zn-dependent protease/CBS domain-containing protein